MEINSRKYKLFPVVLFFLCSYLYLYIELYAATEFASTQAPANQTIPFVDLAELDFQVSVGATTIAPGDVIPFYLTITNTTNSPLEPIALVTMPPNYTSFVATESTVGWLQSGSETALCYDGLPAGFSCTLVIDSLLAGETVVHIFAVQVNSDIPIDAPNISLSANIYPADQQPPAPYIAPPASNPPVTGQDSPIRSTLFLPFFN